MQQKLAITRTCFEEAQKLMRMRATYPPTFGGNVEQCKVVLPEVSTVFNNTTTT